MPTKIEYSTDFKIVKGRIITDRKIKDLSGHDIVKLSGLSPYGNKLDLILNLITIRDKFVDSPEMEVGRELEKPIITTYLGHENIKCFPKENGTIGNDFGIRLLPDFRDLNNNNMYEVKTYYKFLNPNLFFKKPKTWTQERWDNTKIKWERKKMGWFLQLAVSQYMEQHEQRFVNGNGYILAYPVEKHKEILENLNTLVIDRNKIEVYILPEEIKNNISYFLDEADSAKQEIFKNYPIIEFEMNFDESFEKTLEMLNKVKDEFELEIISK